jgi:hypothetical protein
VNKELEQLQHNDLLTDLASAIEQKGCRRVLLDFKHCYPNHFKEIMIQIHRLETRPVAKLLQKEEGSGYATQLIQKEKD